MKCYEVKQNDNPRIKERKYKSLMCINETDMSKLKKNKEAKIVGVLDLSNHQNNPYVKTSSLKVQNDIFIKSAIIHFLFVWVHSFYDGNGRTARLILKELLIREGLGKFENISISK